MANGYFSQFKSRLERIKKEIENKLKGLQRAPDFGDDVDPDIETHETEAMVGQISLAQSLKGRLLAINDALWKIGKKKYGVCEKCGKKISEELLEVVPESRLCKECKKKH